MAQAIHRRSVQMLLLLAIVVTALFAPYAPVQQAEDIGYDDAVSRPSGAGIFPGLGVPSTWAPIKIRIYPNTSNISIEATWGPTYPAFLPIQEAILIYNYDSFQVMFWEVS